MPINQADKARTIRADHPKAATEELVVQNTNDELLIYDLSTNRAICLNQTAALVWKNCDGQNDVGKITESVEKTLKSPIDEDLILFGLSQLNDEGLLLNGKSLSNVFRGLSRREVVKKIGFASMVALPIISAVVAPKAIYAQSCVNPGGGAPGTGGNNPFDCTGNPPAFCTNFCATDATFLSGCCSGAGVLSPPGVCLGATCSCLCA